MKLSDFSPKIQEQIRRQLDAHTLSRDTGLCAVQSKPDERMPLGVAPEREETCWYDAAASFEVCFTIYSTRPCDYDGYDIKALQDFLVTAGIIPDDGWKTLSGRVRSCKAATQAEERTEIELTAIQ